MAHADTTPTMSMPTREGILGIMRRLDETVKAEMGNTPLKLGILGLIGAPHQVNLHPTNTAEFNEWEAALDRVNAVWTETWNDALFSRAPLGEEDPPLAWLYTSLMCPDSTVTLHMPQ